MQLNMRFATPALAAVFLVSGLCMGALVYAHADWPVVNTFEVGGAGGWDYLTVDPQTHRLYVPQTTHTLVIDATTGKTVADIPRQQNAHGVALAPQMRRRVIN